MNALHTAAFGLICMMGCASAPSAPPAAPPIKVWIDVDTSAGLPKRDIDDAVALVQAFHAPELEVQGVSVVFGNTSLDQALPITEVVTQRFGPRGLEVYPGAASAADLGRPTPATRALIQALLRAPMVLLVLGPATNIASVLKLRPDLAPRIERIIAVAGRRPGQRFTTGSKNLRGHRDFNFEKDPEAFRVILDTDVPLTLAPWELSSTVWLTDVELARWSAGPPATRWLAQAAPSWLQLWGDTFGVSGFNPFDTLAVAVLTQPQHLTCEVLPISITTGPNDVTDPAMQGGATADEKPYLVVDATATTPKTARYCSRASAEFREALMQRLLTP